MTTASSAICITGLRGFPGVMGGIESHCEELLPRIKSAAPDLMLTVLGRAPYLPERHSRHRNAEVVGMRCPRSKHFETILSTLSAIIEARRRGASIVHIHAIGPALLSPLARLLGMRVIVTHHGTDYDRAKWGRLAKIVLRSGERAALSFADRVIAISPSLAETLRRTYPAKADRIHNIPNGTPILPGQGEADSTFERLGIGDSPFLMAVGRLVPEKGLHDLIDAHATGDQDRKLVIVGGADHDSAYVRDLQGRAGDRVILRANLMLNGSLIYVQLVFLATVRVQELAIGAGIGLAAVGVYRTAWRVVELIGRGAIQPFTQVAVQTLARVRDDRVQLARAYQWMIARASALSFPALVGSGVLAPTVPLVFGDK